MELTGIYKDLAEHARLRNGYDAYLMLTGLNKVHRTLIDMCSFMDRLPGYDATQADLHEAISHIEYVRCDLHQAIERNAPCLTMLISGTE